MSQRSRQKAKNAGEDAHDECARLRQLAQDQNVVSKERSACTNQAKLPKHLASADSKDILKKSSSRKGRYLFHISAEFQPIVGGRMGTLAKLDSKNPVLYFEFPSGRLKMVGTLMFPKAKYLLLQFGTKAVICEEVFESVVLFAEMHWIGSQEANPTEVPLDMPAELQQDIVRKTAAGEPKDDSCTPLRRKRSPTGELASQPATQRRRGTSELRSAHQTAAKRKARTLEDSSGDEDSDDSEEAVVEAPLSQRQHLGRSSKTAAQRRLNQEHTSDEDSEDSGNLGAKARAACDEDEDGKNDAGSPSDSAIEDGSPEPAARRTQEVGGKQHRVGRQRSPAKGLPLSDDRERPVRQRRVAAAGRAAGTMQIIDSDDSEEKASAGSGTSQQGSEDEVEEDDDGDEDWDG